MKPTGEKFPAWVLVLVVTLSAGLAEHNLWASMTPDLESAARVGPLDAAAAPSKRTLESVRVAALGQPTPAEKIARHAGFPMTPPAGSNAN